MKHTTKVRLVVIGLLVTALLFSSCKKKSREYSADGLPVLKGDFLGQSPPGEKPELFAPGIVSTGAWEYSAAFSNDGKEFYFAVSGVPHNVILMMKKEKNCWTLPEVAPFSGQYDDYDLNFSPEGNRLYFTSKRPLRGTGEPKSDTDLWVTEKTDTGWSEPLNLGSPINSSARENYVSAAADGTLYFHRTDNEGTGDTNIYRARLVNGQYAEPEKLSSAVNSENFEWDPFIASDESYLIFGSVGREDGNGQCDLYISFRQEDYTWTQAVNLGNKINSSAHEFTPSVCPAGKYIFFMSNRKLSKPYSEKPLTAKEKFKMLNSPGNGNGDIYWVSASIISKLRPVEKE